MRMLFEASSHSDLIGMIRSVRNRWRLRIVLRGLGILLAGGIVSFLISAYGMDYFRFTPAAVAVFQVLTYGTLMALLVRFLIIPLARKVSDERVALYLEEHEPSLHGYVLSGVQFGDDAEKLERAGHSPELVRRMLRQAIERCVAVEEGNRVERKGLATSSGFLAGATVAGMAFVLLSPGFLEHSAPFLLTPWNEAATTNPYSITVVPGNVTVARGADLRITAILQNFNSNEVDLAVKRSGESQWDRWPMTVDEETGEFALLLFDLSEQTEYYVEASSVRSPLFRIDVADLPYVDQIDVEYHFPAYTGLSPQRQENTGDIAALRGTRVELRVTATMPVTNGVLVLDDRDTIPLQPGEEGLLKGTMNIRDPGQYRVLLQGFEGDLVVASPDYIIDVLTDQSPVVSFSKPGRDITVTSVEEVFTELQAEDDYGLARLELIYSVNGGAQDTVLLFGGGSVRKQVTASHTMFIEELELEPGDLISYYGRVSEADRGPDTQGAMTDIYFMEVRPFEREYRQGEQPPGMSGGGGAGEMSGDLSRRQRDIIAGTFRMVRDRDEYTDAEYNENLVTLALAQGRLREEVEVLVQRINTRGIVQLDSTFRAIAEELPQAIEAMEAAEEELGERDAPEALPPEQRALQHLQRAEAAYREVQVSRGSGGGGGGGGQESDMEDLADLFDLELDRMRNQYEQIQRGQQEQVDQELDEITQKLRELARRQQQENERMRAAQQNLQNQAGGGGGGQSQRRLAEEAEELARQLERLSREQGRPELEETVRNLQEAAEAMRRAASNSRNSGVAQGVEALDQLREARRLMDQNRTGRLQRDVQDALRRAQRLAQEQQETQQDVADLSMDARTRAEQINRLRQRKEAMAQEVAGIEAELEQMSRESQGEQQEAARELREAAASIRDNKLREKILYSRGVIEQGSPEYARNLEDQIASNIDELTERIAAGLDAIGESREQRLARSLDRTRDAVNALESLNERMRAAAEQGSEQSQQGQQGQQGRQGQSEGGGDERTAMPPSMGGGGGGQARLLPGDVRQFQRELRERQNELSELRDELRREDVDVDDLGEVIAGIRDFQRELGEPLGLDELELEVIQGLKDFEFNLRKELLGEAAAERLYLAGSDDVPEGYRELVDQYYRELSRRGGGGNR
ncbi:MAG: DUF4175 family protein [Gemmatimonadota bacterium]|nr:MAG: DUF4175 family protein [Gemmatimonadota bacterium]